jgi:hypothetical protein
MWGCLILRHKLTRSQTGASELCIYSIMRYYSDVAKLFHTFDAHYWCSVSGRLVSNAGTCHLFLRHCITHQRCHSGLTVANCCSAATASSSLEPRGSLI